jgi:hypothetical protein
MEPDNKKITRYLTKALSITNAATDTIRFTQQSWDYEIKGISIKAVDTATLRTLLASGLSINSIRMGSEDLMIGDAVDHSFFAIDGGTFLKDGLKPMKVAKGKEIQVGITNNAAAAHTIFVVLSVEVRWEDYSNQ